MKGLLRVWNELDLADIEKYLIVVGELSSECFSCHKIDLELKAQRCPNCGTYFKYMGFRRKVQISFLKKVKEELSYLILIDFDDFKKATGSRDARKILDI
jgi:Zn finger protein HypA/HybF involved in hydrogenase expression